MEQRIYWLSFANEQKFLGAAMNSPNYTVGPTARSDGIMRIFHVETAYGKYDFDGVEFTKLRLREIV